MKKLTVFLISIMFVSVVVAQPLKSGHRARKPRVERIMPKHRAQLPMVGNHKGQRGEKMEMMMAMKLTEELSLTPEQGDKFFPRMKEHREKMNKIDGNVKSLVKKMNGKIEGDKKISDKELNSFFDGINKLEQKRFEEKDRFMKDLDGTLDNNQRFKLAMFKHKFVDDMQVKLKAKK